MQTPPRVNEHREGLLVNVCISHTLCVCVSRARGGLTAPVVLRHLCFGRLTCSKYLLGATEDGTLCCWNLLSCARKMSFQRLGKARTGGNQAFRASGL